MTTRIAGFACLALLSLVVARNARPQTPPWPATDNASSEPFQISVSLNLVVLPVTVRDRKGGFAADLRQTDFEVYEDGVKQSIRLFRHEDIPVTVGLVVDHSGSMQRKMPDVLAAAQTFVKNSNPEDQIFVVNFNERVTLGLPPDVPFATSADDLESAILRAPLAGETALYDAIDVALGRLHKGEREKKVLIVISDGGDNASVIAMHQVLKKAAESNAVIYTIGIFDQNDPDQDPAVLRRLARETGGDAFFPAQYNDTVAVCEGIAKDIRHQYTIGYVSGNTQPGGHRAVRVVARAAGKDLSVRTRPGYVATGEPPEKKEGAK
jgi:VWFA-related protein